MTSSQANDHPAAVLIDKPAGPTSHDIVQGIRREFGAKAGHAGTLDPFATGLLICLLGRATRLQRYLLDLPKRYEATARLGWVSSTGDPTGNLQETGRIPDDLSLPTGPIQQRVPMTSAVRVGGERLYDKAHRGEQIETPVRERYVESAELVSSGDGYASYLIECASGTYIRTLIETLDDAYCERLRRVAAGPFEVPDRGRRELTTAELLAFMPERVADEEEADRIGHGAFIPAGEIAVSGLEQVGDERVRVSHAGNVVAVARLSRRGELEPEVVLR